MRLRVLHLAGFALAIAMIVATSVSPAYAGFVVAPAPEIDGNTVISGQGLLGAGAMMLRARRARK